MPLRTQKKPNVMLHIPLPKKWCPPNASNYHSDRRQNDEMRDSRMVSRLMRNEGSRLTNFYILLSVPRNKAKPKIESIHLFLCTSLVAQLPCDNIEKLHGIFNLIPKENIKEKRVYSSIWCKY